MGYMGISFNFPKAIVYLLKGDYTTKHAGKVLLPWQSERAVIEQQFPRQVRLSGTPSHTTQPVGRGYMY